MSEEYERSRTRQSGSRTSGRSSSAGRRVAPSSRERAVSGRERTTSSRERSTSGRERMAPNSREQQPPKPVRRKKKRRGARLSSAILYVLFVIGLSAVLATVGWVWAGDVLALNKAPISASITVEKEETFNQVVDELKDAGLIEYKFLFKLFAVFTNGVDGVSPGTYNLDTEMDYRAILTNLGRNSAARQVVTVTIPEGYTIDQTFKLLEEKGVSTVEELENMAATYDYKFTWLQNVIPLGDYHRLEGYLFPDTYDFYAGEDPKYAINKMLANFERRMEDYFDEIEASGQTLRDIVNVASMIERETAGTDQTHIASVIYNRLKNNSGGTYGYLQIDATIQYALDEHKEVLSEADKNIDSPYNTYKYPGLPAGPICNPGMKALYAAMNPDTTKYYYYALGDDGVHHFFATYQQQQAFIATPEMYH